MKTTLMYPLWDFLPTGICSYKRVTFCHIITVSLTGSDHVAESTVAYHAPADSFARPAGISDDEWQLLQAARREKAQTSGTSGSTSSEENRA